MDVLLTLADIFGTYRRCACGFMMELELIFIELWTFELSNFCSLFCTADFQVCVSNPSYSFKLMFLTFRRHITGILSMCVCALDGPCSNF